LVSPLDIFSKADGFEFDIAKQKIFQKSILIKNNAIKTYIKNNKAGEDIQPFV
jgi:hypothetical protein